MEEKKKGLSDTIKTSDAAQKVKGWSTKKKVLIGIGAIVLIGAIVTLVIVLTKKNDTAPAEVDYSMVNTTAAYKTDISSEISASGTIAPKDSYDITALVSGEIISADFEEGDQVKEGQVLYQVDVAAMQSQLEAARITLDRATTAFEEAEEDFNKAEEKYKDNTYVSNQEGYVTDIKLHKGDKATDNSQISQLYSDKQMTLTIPFLAPEAAAIGTGSAATIILADSGEQLGAKVESVSALEEVIDGGRIVRDVTFRVTNPGGLTKEMEATAIVGNFMSAGTGHFEPILDNPLMCSVPITLEVEKVLIHDGDYVKEGTPLFTFTEDSGKKLKKHYQDIMDSAQLDMEKAKQDLDKTSETCKAYTVRSPISGKVVAKIAKAGDKINVSSSNSSVLAKVYDLSSYLLEIPIDEYDILKVEIGQKVRIEAGALSGESFDGVVTNVSMINKSENGRSTYPVTITLDSTKRLIPGMTVNGYIILEEKSDVLVIPPNALISAGTVYVKDPSVTTPTDGIPAGFRRADVTTGIVTSDYVEIIDGINEGDEVYLP